MGEACRTRQWRRRITPVGAPGMTRRKIRGRGAAQICPNILGGELQLRFVFFGPVQPLHLSLTATTV